MATIKGGQKFLNALAVIAKKLGQPRTLRVGFLAGATYPDGTSVAMVAAIQNFGAPSRGIPPRPFFSNMVAKRADGWPKGIAAQLKATGNDVDKTLEITGDVIRSQLQIEIRETNAPPLAEATLGRRGYSGKPYNKKNPKTYGAKPLIDTGHMINSVDKEITR